MKKLITLIALFLITIMTASAVDLSDYPDFFIKNGSFNGIIVIGENAPGEDVVSAIDIATAFPVPIGASRLDSEINDITDYNAIVIGSPCVNSAAAELEGETGSKCSKSLEEGKGYIKLFEHGNRVQILVTGLESTDRRAAARVLARYKEFTLEGDAMEVDGWMRAPTKYSNPNTASAKKSYTALSTDEEIQRARAIREDEVRQLVAANEALQEQRYAQKNESVELIIYNPAPATQTLAEKGIIAKLVDAFFGWF